jgi:hypothetical protein
MTITCKRCGAEKGRSFFRDNDILRKTFICRACRGSKNTGARASRRSSATWRNSNTKFFGQQVREDARLAAQQAGLERNAR